MEEVAAYLRVNKATIYKLLKKGIIPRVRVDGPWRFRREAVVQWLENQSRVADRN
ncbi:MAG TPA: helix-turn-helix domain-containing protein [Thermoflexia bacterium]|nr:helix-turn-helix domain-containing protein [Thermoflexia bacterium]